MPSCPNCKKTFKYNYLVNRHLNSKRGCNVCNSTKTEKTATLIVEKSYPNYVDKTGIKHVEFNTNNINLSDILKNQQVSKNVEFDTNSSYISNKKQIKNKKYVEFNTNNSDIPNKKNIKNGNINDYDKNKNSHQYKTECHFCKKKYSSKYIVKHYRESCNGIPNKIRDTYINDYNNNKLRKKSNDKIDKINGLSKNKTFNSNIKYSNTNNGVITNISGDQNINITNVISINPFGKENIKMTTEEKQKILDAKERGYHETLKCIFNKTENRNFFTSGKNYVCCLDDDGNLGLQDKKDALYSISDTGEKAYNQILTDKYIDMPKRQKKVNNIKAVAINNGEYNTEHFKYSELILVEKSVANEKFLKGKFKTLDDQFLNELGKNYVLKINN